MSDPHHPGEPVVLLRYVPGPIYRDTWFRLFWSGVLCTVLSLQIDGFGSVFSLATMGILMTVISAGAMFWIRPPVLVTIAGTGVNRTLTVARPGLLSAFREQRWTTDEAVTLRCDQPEGSVLAKFPVLLEGYLEIGGTTVATLFSSPDDSEVERFRAAARGFDHRAERVPCREMRKERETAKAKAEKKKRAEQLCRFTHPFERAVARDDVRAVERLLTQGLEVDRSRIDRELPLAAAAQSGAIGIVQLLLDCGAVATPRALALAAWNAPEAGDASYEKHLAVARLLLERGASPDGDTEGADTVREAFDEAGVAFVALIDARVEG